MSDLQQDLLDARSWPDILDALGRLLWATNTDGEDCPEEMIPTPEALAEWMRNGWPDDVRQEAVDRTLACAGIVNTWADGPDRDPAEAAEASRSVSVVLLRMATQSILPLEDMPEAEVTAIRNASGDPGAMEGTGWVTEPHAWFHFGDTHELWVMANRIARIENSGAVPHPVASTVRAWQTRPVSVEPDTRQDRRILPAVRIVEARPERQRGMLFGGLLEGRDPNPKLPMFEAEPVRKSVAILELADASGVPVMAKGRGAPLPARLFVRSALAVKLEDRRRESVRMALTLRELRDGLFPNGWRVGQHWPALKAALIGARDYTIRLPDDGRWFMLALRRLPSEDPRGAPSLDAHVVIDLAFPPGASDGPIIDLPVVDALSVESAPRWRAYIAGHTLIWEPGKTRRRPGHRARFVWSRDPNDYPVVTREDRKRLAFGEKDRKNRTRAEIDAAWRDLPGLDMMERVIDRRTGEVGWRIMPSDAGRDSDGPETEDE